MRSLHSQSATVDLASGAVVLSHTVTTATALADLILEVGNGTNDLAAAAETTLTVAITIDSAPVRGSDPTETVEVGRGRLRIPVDTFPVATGEQVVVTLTSDQPADSAVVVTATLRDASPIQPVTRGRQVKADADGLVELTNASTELVANAVSDQADIAALIAAWVDGGRLDLIVDAIKAKTDLLSSSRRVVISGPGFDDDTATLVRAMDYLTEDGMSVTFDTTTPADIDGATITWRARHITRNVTLEGGGSVTSATEPKSVSMDATADELTGPPGEYGLVVMATLSSGNTIAIAHGTLELEDDWQEETCDE